MKYRDLDLFVLLDPKTREEKLLLQVRLESTKSRRSARDRKLSLQATRSDPTDNRRTYTFNVDSVPMFCVISHLIALAHDDKAFAAPDLTSPEKVFKLRVKPGLRSQPITWKKRKLDTPVFRLFVKI